MAKTRLKFNRKAFETLDKSPAALALIKEKVEAVEKACNEQSSWGGYASSAAIHSDRVRGTVWSYDNRSDEARAQRLLRNLDA